MKNYAILAEYQRQYVERFKDRKEPLIMDSTYGDGIEMDIDLPFLYKFEPFRVSYNNTENIKVTYMGDDGDYLVCAWYKESQKVREVNLHNLMACASNLMWRRVAAKDFENKFVNNIKKDFGNIQVENYDEDIAGKYCRDGYNPQAIKDCYRLLSYCCDNYNGRESWRDNDVDSYAAKHVFEYILGQISDTTYVHTSEFAAAAVMLYSYRCKMDKLKIVADGPNWNMTLPDYYDVLSYLYTSNWRA